MDVILALVGLVTVGALIFGIFHWVRRRWERIEEAWTEAARAVGGTVDTPSGFLAGTGIGIRASLEGTEIVVRLDSDTTRLTAPVPEAGNLRLSIRRGRVSTVGRALGFQDVEIGDPAFDEAFVVTTNNESLARSWLTPDVRQQVSRVPSYTFSLADGEVVALGGGSGGVETDSRVLEAAIRAVAAVASRGRAGVEQRLEPASAPPQAGMPPARLREMRFQSAGAVIGGVMLLGVAALARGKPSVIDALSVIAVAYALAAPVLALCLRRGVLGTWTSEKNLPGQGWEALRRKHQASFWVLQGAVVLCSIAVLMNGRNEPLYAAALPLATMVLCLPRRPGIPVRHSNHS